MLLHTYLNVKIYMTSAFLLIYSMCKILFILSQLHLIATIILLSLLFKYYILYKVILQKIIIMISLFQHVSSYGDNTSVSPTTAILTADSCNNFDQNSWSGQVQPYSIPLDVLHADGKCLFIEPTNTEHVVIKVNLIVPWVYFNDSMLARL